MIIYYIDGLLKDTWYKGFENLIDGKYGFKHCEEQIDMLLAANRSRDRLVITNVPYFLSAKYGWNDKSGRYDIHIRCNSGQFENIHKLTNRELKQSHNLCNLYIAGEFDEGIRNN